MRMRTVTAVLVALVPATVAPAAVRAAVATPTPTPTTQPAQVTPTPTPTPTPVPIPTPAKRTKADKRVYSDYAADGVISACKHSVKTLRHTLRTITPEFAANFPDFKPAVKAAIARHRNGGCTPASNNHPTGGTTAPGSSSTPVPTVTPVATATAAPSTLQPASPTSPAESGRLPGGVTRSGGGARTPQQALSPSASATPSGPAAAESGITPVVTPTPTPPPLVVEHAGGHDLTVPGVLLGLAILVAVLLGLSAVAAARSPRLAGMHHAWREAGYRTRGTWRDFAEWLRLGR